MRADGTYKVGGVNIHVQGIDRTSRTAMGGLYVGGGLPLLWSELTLRIPQRVLHFSDTNWVYLILVFETYPQLDLVRYRVTPAVFIEFVQRLKGGHRPELPSRFHWSQIGF